MKQKNKKSNIKILLLITILLGIGVLFKYIDVLPGYNQWGLLKEQIHYHEKLLSRHNNILHQKDKILDQYKKNKQAIEQIETKIFHGTDTHISTAQLQKDIQKLSEDNDIQIKRTSAGKPDKIADNLSIISLGVIAETGSMKNLNGFLKAIEYYDKKFIYIPRLYLKSVNKRLFIELQVLSIAST